jgi:hypothetical protein
VDRGPYRSTGTILLVYKTGLTQREISMQFKDPYDIALDASGEFDRGRLRLRPVRVRTRGSKHLPSGL